MDDYLTKPIDEAMLTHVLCRYHSGKPHIAEQPMLINWSMALRQAANKQDMARDLLQMLLGFLPQVNERVQARLNGQPDDSILDLIYKLHGICC